MATEIIHSDLDLMFNIHPIRKELMLSINEQAIIRSVKNLVLTNHYEKPFQAGVGSNVRKMLFEPFTPSTSNYVRREIYNVISTFEPRVTGLTVDVYQEEDENALKVDIKFYIQNSTTLTTVSMLLERLR